MKNMTMLSAIVPMWLIGILSVIIICSCDSSTAPRKTISGLSSVIDYPRPDKEAEEAALWLSGELEAPEEMYVKIRNDLIMIRGSYLPVIPEVGITFHPPWVPGTLLAKVTDEAKQQIRQGEYHDLDSLNAYYHLAKMDTNTLFTNLNLVILKFKGRLHPDVLSVPYGAVSSVVWASPNGYIGDFSNVYPWTYGNVMTYLFRKGEGDCPSGCIDSYFRYFKVSDLGIVDFIGSWKRGDLPVPEWWAEAKVAYERFRYGK